MTVPFPYTGAAASAYPPTAAPGAPRSGGGVQRRARAAGGDMDQRGGGGPDRLQVARQGRPLGGPAGDVREGVATGVDAKVVQHDEGRALGDRLGVRAARTGPRPGDVVRALVGEGLGRLIAGEARMDRDAPLGGGMRQKWDEGRCRWVTRAA